MTPQRLKRFMTSSPTRAPTTTSTHTQTRGDTESEASSVTSHISFRSISNALRNIFHIRRPSKKSSRPSSAPTPSPSRPHAKSHLLNLNRRGSTSIETIAPWEEEDIETRLKSERRTHMFSTDHFSGSALSLILPPPPPDANGDASDDLSYVGILRLVGSNSPVPPLSPPQQSRKFSLRKIASRSELENALHSTTTFADAATQQHTQAALPAEKPSCPKFNIVDYATPPSPTSPDYSSLPRRFSLRYSKSSRRPSACSTVSTNSNDSRWEFTIEQTGLTAPPKSRWQIRSAFPFGFGTDEQDLPGIPGTPAESEEEDGGEDVPPDALVEASKLVRIGQGILEATEEQGAGKERKQSITVRPRTLRRTACSRLPREARAGSFAGMGGIRPSEEGDREYLVPTKACLKSLYTAGN